MIFYILGTPIGNIADISFRFLETITKLEYLIVEDTRKTLSLLKALTEKHPEYDFNNKSLISYYKGNESKKITKIMNLLQEGHSLGLLSDAGMPGISDPGAEIIASIRRANYSIKVIPGPSALTTALSLSGFQAKQTLFVGFLAKKTKDKQKLFKKIINNPLSSSLSLVFFESPKRIRETISLVKENFPLTRLFLGRDLTKQTEQLIWAKTKEINPKDLVEKGEYTGVLFIK